MLQWIYKLENNKKTIAGLFIFFVVVFLLLIVFFSLPALAQQADSVAQLEAVGQRTDLGTADLRLVIAQIIRAFLGLLGIIALILILYAGYTIMTAAGDEQKIITGKKILINATIGMAIILGSFSITQFIINQLGKATGYGDFAGRSGTPIIRQSFSGSGSLGTIIGDHYPFRNQREVARNTKISVTFREPIDASSLVDDSNNTGIFGDCINTSDSNFDWGPNYCDQLKTSAVEFYQSSDSATLLLAAVFAIADANSDFYTFTFKPLEMLGSDSEDVDYTVKLTNNILKTDGVGVFENSRGEKSYWWEFTTGNEFDFDPPYITAVYPRASAVVARNTIIQINFNEAVDPSVTQGLTGTFYHIIFGDQTISGDWRITNGYRTVEFVSDQACGENSCGQEMFCLPSNCPAGDISCSDAQQVLARTADTISNNNFESLPFSGVMDMAGNALDGNNDKIRNGKPAIGNALTIDAGEEAPDNYLWNFRVQNIIDRTAPYVIEVDPEIDEEGVLPNEPQAIRFSKPMWLRTLASVSIIERFYNSSANSGVNSMWYSLRSEIDINDQTILNIKHREFGPNNEDAYYFTSIPSEVKSVNQNCIYPGRGPYSQIKGAPISCNCNVDQNGNLSCDNNCVDVVSVDIFDTGCVQTSDANQRLKGSVAECIQVLESLSPTQ